MITTKNKQVHGLSVVFWSTAANSYSAIMCQDESVYAVTEGSDHGGSTGAT